MIKYRKGYKYQLAESYQTTVAIYPNKPINTEFVCLSLDGKLFISRGYAWDGASGPTFDTKTSMRGSLVHDALYQLIRQGLLGVQWKYIADRELQRNCIEAGMWKPRAWLWFRAVQKIAGYAASPENRKQIHTAP